MVEEGGGEEERMRDGGGGVASGGCCALGAQLYLSRPCGTIARARLAWRLPNCRVAVSVVFVVRTAVVLIILRS